jgi:signal transduction histidine kinase
MKLQARFLLLYVFLFGTVATLLLFQRSFELDRSRVVLQNELTQRRSYFQKISSIEGKPLETLAVDYSSWDDMVTFVKQRNIKFAQDNIDTGLGNFHVDTAWVYRPDHTLVYFKSANDDPVLQDLKLPTTFFDKLTHDRFAHFYIQEDSGLLEIRAATIHPGDDSARKTTPQGFWVVGRYLDKDVLNGLGDLTQSKLTLNPPTANAGDVLQGDTVAFSQPLNSWNGRSVALITSKATVPVVNDLQNLYNRQLLLLLLFTIASGLAVVISIWRLVLKPMRQIAKSIREQKPDQLDRLAFNHDEFGNLARTVQEFFQQKVSLQESEFLKGKLVELNKTKSEFLAIAAHELKGPVGNIHIFAENLADLLKGPTSKATLVTETQRISQQAHKATVLINDLYQASKGGQTMQLNRVEFDFDAFIRAEIEDAQYATHQKIVVDGPSGHVIISDRDRLSQVVNNLIRNASKYSKPRTLILVHWDYDDANVTVQVADAGLGIPAAEQSKVFGRFFRSNQVTKDYPGLGLGLSVCKEIVEGLGGKIWLSSQEGQGTTMYFSLPLSSGNQQQFSKLG